MNWNQIQTLFDGQGIVFWAALAAVALGLTLLSVSVFFQVRKMFVPVATIGAPASAPAADPRLANLLQRLKSSADRLDRIHSSLGRIDVLSATTTDSPLKPISEEVDYIYRTGRA